MAQIFLDLQPVHLRDVHSDCSPCVPAFLCSRTRRAGGGALTLAAPLQRSLAAFAHDQLIRTAAPQGGEGGKDQRQSQPWCGDGRQHAQRKKERGDA